MAGAPTKDSAPKQPWRIAVREKQQSYYEMLGDRDWDCYKESEVELLERNLGYAIFGLPNELPDKDKNGCTGYQKEQLAQIRKLSAIIKQHSKDSPECSGSDVLVSTIYVCLNYEEHVVPFPIFRMPGCGPEDKWRQGPDKFVDSNCRVYKDWADFLGNNQLPKCTYCYPRGGVYDGDGNDNVLLDFGQTPACKFTNRLWSALDTAGTFVMVGGTAVSVATLFTAVAAPVAAAATAGAVWSGVYGAARSVGTLVDRGRHEQSVGLEDAEARNCWISVAGNTLGIASAKGVQYLTEVTQKGQVLCKTGRVVVNALNYGSLAVNGLGLINTLVALHEKYHSKDLTPLEVFQFASSVLFFTMSAMNTKTASTVIKETQSGIIKDFEGSLRSNRHRRMFRRVAKQTHGKDGNTMQGNAKVIRGITHIGDKDDFFAGLVRVQKQLSKSGAKVAFTETGLVEINGELHLHPMDFSAIDKAQRQVILDATKNLSEGTWTHQQFNEEVKTICQEQQIAFRSRQSETMASVKETISSVTEKGSNGLKENVSKMKGGQVDTLTSYILNFGKEHHKRIIDISFKLAESLGFKKTAEFLRVVEFFVTYVQQVVDEVEAKYQKDVQIAQTSQAGNFNREQFDKEYHIEGNRKKHFITTVLTNYNTPEALCYLKEAFVRLFKANPSESKDSVKDESKMTENPSSDSSHDRNSDGEDGGTHTGVSSAEDSCSMDENIGADGNTHIETMITDQGADGSAHIETMITDEGADGNTHIETMITDEGADGNASIETIGTEQGADGNPEILYKKRRDFEKDGDLPDNEIYTIAQEVTGLYLFEGNTTLFQEGMVTFVTVTDPHIEPVMIIVNSNVHDGTVTAHLVL